MPPVGGEFGAAGGMIYWIDAQLPPQLASWLNQAFIAEAALRHQHLSDAEDEHIFQKAHKQGIVIISKDSDFVEMVLRLGIPPQVLWVTCGNATNRRLQVLLTQVLHRTPELLLSGEAVVEIAGHEVTKIK
jgi:predicted nuclease of predicted toxin-antitoxin system